MSIAAVVIGRNEGDRLRRCLESLLAQGVWVVYVDSGSSDGSVAMAQARGVDVVALDMTQPFTAARARNAGFARVMARQSGIEFVQFVDGDCEVQPGWIERAAAFLVAHPRAAVTCGRRRERYPDRSVYNQLCDWEWAVPPGPAQACGGDAMMRVAALQQAGGYRDDLIAGEEPELCVRLRARGWEIHVLPAEMTLHDAALTRLGQWWTRTVRAGHAYAEGAWLHGRAPERHAVRPLARAVFWGLGWPLVAALVAVAIGPAGWLLLLLYPLQWGRLLLTTPGTLRERWARAGFLMLGKFAEAQGALKFWWMRLQGRRGELIEYK